MNNNIKKIIAILFSKGDPVSFSDLAKILGVTVEEIKNTIDDIKAQIEPIGLSLVSNEVDLQMVLNPEMSEFVSTKEKEEQASELSKASLETLAIVAYRGPVSKKELELIRGVNCSYILRSLEIRGLVNKTGKQNKDYEISVDLLKHLGVEKVAKIPEYEDLRKQVEEFEVSYGEKEADKKE